MKHKILDTFNKKIKPRISLFDVKMMTILPTSKEPMRSFIDKIKLLENKNPLLSISIIHGFMAGDSPDPGAKIVVITDNNKKYGDKISYELGMELFSKRKNLAPKSFSAMNSLKEAKKLSKKNNKPILIADIWDNPGGGVPGDSTTLIKKAISMKLKNIALGSIWDPLAVKLCHKAGENKKINLISQHTEELARDRHIIDCAQIIDLIDENHLSCTDLGSGSGLPGLVIAIIKKKQKSKMKFFLYEKSFKKSNFLKKVINKFELNAEVINQNIFDKKKLNSDLIVARAFKPLPVILDLVAKNFDDFKDIILFLGKSGKSSIEQCLQNWNLEFIEKKSVTEKDSIIIKINKVSKKK